MKTAVHTTRCAKISSGAAGFNNGKNAANEPQIKYASTV